MPIIIRDMCSRMNIGWVLQKQSSNWEDASHDTQRGVDGKEWSASAALKKGLLESLKSHFLSLLVGWGESVQANQNSRTEIQGFGFDELCIGFEDGSYRYTRREHPDPTTHPRHETKETDKFINHRLQIKTFPLKGVYGRRTKYATSGGDP